MKFTVTVTDINPARFGTSKVDYKVESEHLNFTGTEYFDHPLPTLFKLNIEVGERVREKMVNEINRLPKNGKV